MNVIVTETLNYKDQDYKEFSLTEGVSYTATWPNEVFIVVISNAPITQVLAAPEEEEEPVVEETTPEVEEPPTEPAPADEDNDGTGSVGDADVVITIDPLQPSDGDGDGAGEDTETSEEGGESTETTEPVEEEPAVPVFEEVALTGDFIISYQYNDRDPNLVIQLMSEAERDAYYKINRVVEEEGVSETNEFWYFIVGGGVGAILIVVLIVCLCRLKRKNDLIVAKVEKLEVMADDKTPDADRNDDFYNSRKSEKMPAMASSMPATAP